jgi:hypothetical protein
MPRSMPMFQVDSHIASMPMPFMYSPTAGCMRRAGGAGAAAGIGPRARGDARMRWGARYIFPSVRSVWLLPISLAFLSQNIASRHIPWEYHGWEVR